MFLSFKVTFISQTGFIFTAKNSHHLPTYILSVINKDNPASLHISGWSKEF